MSKCRPKNEDFIAYLKTEIEHVLRYHGCYDLIIYYDADPYYSKRDYVLRMTVPSDWNGDDTKWFKHVLSKRGASNVIGCKRSAIARDFLDLAFDEKIRKKILDNQTIK